MLEFNTSSKIGIGVVVLAMMLGIFLSMRPKTAEPGRMPAVASPTRSQSPASGPTATSLAKPGEQATSLVTLEDGSFGAGLSTADHEKFKSGQTVEIKTGGGSVTFSTSPLEKKP